LRRRSRKRPELESIQGWIKKDSRVRCGEPVTMKYSVIIVG
jgi:hypothetical protein